MYSGHVRRGDKSSGACGLRLGKWWGRFLVEGQVMRE